MAKCTPKQIEQSLLEQYKVWRRGSDTSQPPLEGPPSGGSGGGGDIYGLGGRGGSPMQIDIGLGGAGRGSTAAGKPRVRPTSSELARHELGLKLQGQGFKKSPTDTRNIQSGAKVWRPGGPEKLSAPPQTPQERLVAQAQLAQRGQDTAEPATVRDLIAAVPGLTKTKIAGTALGGGLLGAGLGLKGVELLSDPSSADQERAEWLEKFDAGLQKSNQEQKDTRQSIDRSQEVLDRLRAKKDKKQMKENKHPRKATRTLQQIEESLRASLAEQDAPPGLPAYTKDGKKIHYSKLNQPLFPAPKSMQKEPGEADKFVASLVPGVSTVVDVADIAKGDYSGVPYMALGLVPGGKILKGPLKRAAKWFGKKGDDAADLAKTAAERTPKKGDPVPGMPGQYYTGEITASGKPKTTSVAPETKPPEPTVKAEPDVPQPPPPNKPLPDKPWWQSQKKYRQGLSKEELERLKLIQDLEAAEKMHWGTKAILGTGLAGTGYGLYKTAPIVYKDYQKTGELDPAGALKRAAKQEYRDYVTTPVPGSTVPDIYNKKDKQSKPTQSSAEPEQNEPVRGATIPDIYKDKRTNESVAAELFASYSSFLNQELLNEAESDKQAPAYTRDQYIGWAKKYAEQYGVPLSLVLHAMYRESGFYGNAEKMRVAKSPTGARGVMQIQPEYAEKGVYKIKIKDLLDPEKNIEAGTRGLAYYFNKYKDPQKALAAYNAGESGAKTYLRTGDPNTIRKAETRNYIKDFQDDVIHQLEKFYPKNKQKVAQVATEILGTAVGAGNAQAADERPQTTTKVTKTDADPNKVRKGKISIGNVVKNLATGQYTDYDTGKPVTDPAKIANFERLYRGEPEKISTAAAGEETFLDKVKRVAAGELTSKVFGDKKKTAVTPVTAEPKAVAPAAPAKKDDEESWFDRLYGIKAAREKQAQIAADVARQEAERKKAAEKPTTVQSTSGVIDYSRNPAAAPKSKLTVEPPNTDPETDQKAWDEYAERMEKLQTAAGDKFSQERAARLEKERQAQASKTDKSADVTTLLQKDQRGLKQAKQAYRGSLASQRLQALNPEITDVNRIEVGQKINLPGQSEPYTVKKGDTLDKIASRAEKSPASTTKDQRQTIDTPYGKVTKGTDADYQRWLAQQPGLPQTYYTSPTSPKTEPSSSEKTSGDNDSADSSQNITRSVSPDAEPVSSIISKKFFSPEERAATVDKALQDIKADSGQTSTDDEPDDIETLLKDIGYTGQEPEKTVRTIDNDDEVEPVTVDADARLKESINTTSNAELHDILRLAGRLK